MVTLKGGEPMSLHRGDGAARCIDVSKEVINPSPLH
jgi:hypothetical protein